MRFVPAVLAAPTLLLALALAPVGEDEVGRLPDDGRPYRLAEVEQLSCYACHAEIAEEWAGSLHGLAWVDPHYQDGIRDKRRPEGCHGCHIPAPLHRLGEVPSQKPPARSSDDEALHFGVSCNTCHLGPDGEILGPWGIETTAHRSVRSPSFEGAGRDALCATCHRTSIGPVIGIARDFDDDGGKKSCVGCHMGAEYRSAAVLEDGTASEERLGRSHRLNGPRDGEFLARAFALGARADGERTVLVIENVAGHRVPGLTTRRFRFEATLLAADGSPVAEAATAIDSRAYLDRGARLELPLAGIGAAVRVIGRHHAPGIDEPLVFVDERVEVGE
jgi:hypothetical protein